MEILTALVIAVLFVWRVVVEFRKASPPSAQPTSGVHGERAPEQALDAGAALFLYHAMAEDHHSDHEATPIAPVQLDEGCCDDLEM